MLFVQVAIPGIPLLLTYSVPLELEEKICAGMTIEVPFRNKKQIGLIIEIFDENSICYSETIKEMSKPIDKIISPVPLLYTWQIALILRLADYYFVPPSSFLKLMLPEKIWRGSSQEFYEITLFTLPYPTEEKIFSRAPRQREIYEALQKFPKGISIEEARKKIGCTKNLIDILTEKKLIRQEKATKLLAPRHIRSLDIHLNSIAKNLTNAQREVLTPILEAIEFFNKIPHSESKTKDQENEISSATADQNSNKEVALLKTENVLKQNLETSETTDSQQAKKPANHPDASGRKPVAHFLLHGITSSGKTEIYLRAIIEAVKIGKQAILLVPEIALTPQLTQYFASIFGSNLAVVHSKLAEGERITEWQRIRRKEALVIIGSRSAIFAPCENPGLIVVDEEHEWYYKSDQKPRYHAKKVAEEIALLTGAILIYGSATPDLESYYRAKMSEPLIYNEKTDPPQRTGSTEKENKNQELRIKNQEDEKNKETELLKTENIPKQSLETSESASQLARKPDCQIASRPDCQLLVLNERIGKSQLPQVTITDLRDELKNRNFSIFSNLLQERLAQTLEQKKQAILFINRRGLHSAMVCRSCGKSIQCPHCAISLTLHKVDVGSYRNSDQGTSDLKGPKRPLRSEVASSHLDASGRKLSRYIEEKTRLLCHYCGHTANQPSTCPNCQSALIRFLGSGTQQIEGELKKMFPQARILRADRDSTSRKNSFEDIYETFKTDKADILIGTQIVAKGLDLPNVTLVGIILADLGLHFPDFHSAERIFQILTQVSGRAGRRDTPGEVILQTYAPEHYAIRHAASQNYLDFATAELRYREELGYPPFGKIIRLLFSDHSESRGQAETEKLFTALTQNQVSLKNKHPIKIQALRPLITKKHNKYRFQIILRGKNPRLILENFPIPRGWQVDIDPVFLD